MGLGVRWLHIGPQIAYQIGGAVGSAYDAVLWFEGQSNELQADAGASAHSDSGYNHFTGFSGATLTMLYATAPVGNPAGPQVYTTVTTKPLQAYAAAGQANQGPWLQAAKYLVRYGGFKSIAVIVTAVSGSSLDRHRGVNANFPTNPPTIYTSFASFVAARQAEYGRAVDALCTVELETDAGNSTDTANAQANMAAYIAAARSLAGNPTMPYLVAQLNAATSFGPNQAAIRAAQAAAVAADINATLLNFDRFPLPLDPHYDSAAQNDMGDEFGAALIDKLKPGRSDNLGSGPAPWWQYAASGITCIASPATAIPRSGPRPKDGDWEVLAFRTYSAATTVSLVDAQGFTLVTSAKSTFSSGTIENNLVLYERPVTQAILDANGGRMPPPTISGGTATRNVARIFGLRGPNKWTVSPIKATAIGQTTNVSSTALSIATATTTANNMMALIIACTEGLNNKVNSYVNANLQGITPWWDSSYNPGDAFIGMAMATATVPTSGTVLGTTTVNFATANVNTAVLALVAP